VISLLLLQDTDSAIFFVVFGLYAESGYIFGHFWLLFLGCLQKFPQSNISPIKPWPITATTPMNLFLTTAARWQYNERNSREWRCRDWLRWWQTSVGMAVGGDKRRGEKKIEIAREERWVREEKLHFFLFLLNKYFFKMLNLNPQIIFCHLSYI